MNVQVIRGLVRCAPDAGARLLTAISLISLLQYLAPAALALVTALLVGRVQDTPRAELLGASAVPLALFALVMGIGHVADAALEPLLFLASSRIDGAHRARVTELAATSPTVDRLEDARTQRLVRAARADPVNWTDRTPGTGVTGLIRLLATFAGVAGSCAVLARFRLWLVPLLLIPALTQYLLGAREHLGFVRKWRESLPDMVRAGLWERTAASPSEAKDVRVYGLGDWIADRIHDHLQLAFRPAWARIRRFTEWWPLILVGVPFGLALALVGRDAATGRTSVATETAVMAAGLSLYLALGFTDSLISVVSAGECLEAYGELEAELRGAADPTQPADTTREVPDRVPLVAFEGVGFRYPGTERTVLGHIDLEIKPGELLALVGLNGAGKSTLIKLLAMLYTPTDGRILADGVDVADYGPEAWRERISVVFQDFVKYELSAEDNVVLGRGGRAPDRAALEDAAREAGLGEVLERLPNGWDTPLARARAGGVDLSGGQWQQVVLTRALYALRQGAKLLVLDEPTAHLDVRTEFEVFQRLADRRGESSIVLISHRLSTVRYADRIVLLDGGRITETGTHEELIALGGEYARMFAIQAERFNAGYEDRLEEGELL